MHESEDKEEREELVRVIEQQNEHRLKSRLIILVTATARHLKNVIAAVFFTVIIVVAK